MSEPSTEKAAPGANPDISSNPNAIPSQETLDVCFRIPVLDRERKEHAFGDIINGPGGKHRVLVIFIRHFFCGACQAYVQKIIPSATLDALKDQNTSIIIIGHGDPALIDHWTETVKCPYPVYTEPTHKIHEALNFDNADYGNKAEDSYYKASTFQGFLDAMGQVVKNISLVHKSGGPKQNGGELLFEIDDAGKKTVTHCHRMQHATDHTPISKMLDIIGIAGAPRGL